MAQRRILVVESNPDHGEAIASLLGVWGHAAVVATSGREAVVRALDDPPDAVVLDLGLPDMDGCKVAAEIRAHEVQVRGAPVIIAYSGYHHREQEALAAGCDAFVLKPNVEELETLVRCTRGEAQQYTQRVGPAAYRRR
jgi:CheY-like chemotaxis protein